MPGEVVRSIMRFCHSCKRRPVLKGRSTCGLCGRGCPQNANVGREELPPRPCNGAVAVPGRRTPAGVGQFERTNPEEEDSHHAVQDS